MPEPELVSLVVLQQCGTGPSVLAAHPAMARQGRTNVTVLPRSLAVPEAVQGCGYGCVRLQARTAVIKWRHRCFRSSDMHRSRSSELIKMRRIFQNVAKG